MKKGYYCLKLILEKGMSEDFQELLNSSGYLGCEIEEGKSLVVKAYYRDRESIPKEAFEICESLEFVEDRNWNEEWKKYFKPTAISERFAVLPSWVEPVFIYPGRTFGTGTHETTKLAVRLLEKVVKPGYSLLDVGAGSGILSIVAKKLGAGRVVACDVDEACREEIPLNCRLNKVEGVEVFIGDFSKLGERFDVVVANIEKHLLEPLVPYIYDKVEKFAVFSGILKEQEKEFSDCLKKFGFTLIETLGEGEWKGFLCKK